MDTMAVGEFTGDHGADGRERVVISSPEELIASVPAMLGFPPGPGSVVLVCGATAAGGQGPVIRVDVPGLQGGDTATPTDEDLFGEAGADAPEGPRETDGGIDHVPAQWLAQFCEREQVLSAHLVVVGEDCTEGYTAGLRAEDAAEAFEYWLGLAGVEVAGAYGVDGFSAGAAWVDLFGMVRGVQHDPGSSHIAAVHAYQGRAGAGSREEIERMYAARDPDSCDVGPVGDPVDTVRGDKAQVRAQMVERHESAAGSLEEGNRVDDDELAVIGRGLLDIGVRDEVYRRLALRRSGDGDGHQLLWWALARRRPPKERSVALLLLGAAAYFSGSGVHAFCALTAAVEADSGNSLARLLLQGLAGGIAPERLRRVAAAA